MTTKKRTEDPTVGAQGETSGEVGATSVSSSDQTPEPVAVSTEPTPAAQDAPAAQVADPIQAERDRVGGIVEALAGTGLEAKGVEYIRNGSSLAQVNADLVAHLKTERGHGPALAQGEKTRTLAAMAQESTPIAAVEGSTDSDKETQEKQIASAIRTAWAMGARNAAAKSGARKVEA